jgi:CelD/BcsL family acetyltransferase involved in cellulose biosynthesis
MQTTRADAPSRYEIRWLTTQAEIDAFAPQWRKLDAESEADYVWFQSYEWCRHWFENHGEGLKPQILVMLEQGTPIAILPLQMKRTKVGIKRFEILGAPHTQYANVLTRQNSLSAQEVKHLRAALGLRRGADTVLFTLVPESTALAQLLKRTKSHASLANESAQFELSKLNGKPFEERLNKDRQRDARRRVRMLEKLGPLKLEVLRPGMAGYRDMIDQCMVMKAAWLGETAKMGDSIMYEGHARFLSSMPQSADPSEGPYVWVMKAGDHPVAIEVGYLQRGHYYAYMGGFDWAHRKASPGKIQMSMTFDALAALGAREYDLLANPTDYKLDYATQTRALSGYVVNLTYRGSMYTALWTRLLRPTLRQTFYALPPSVRQALAFARRHPIYVGV